jgi:hypothetical protein
MKKLLLILLCLPLLFNSCEEEQSVAPPTSPASQFAGNWLGSFEGGDTGVVTVSISISGVVSGTTNTGTPDEDIISGTVTNNGALSATVGAVSTGAEFEGQLSGTSGTGTWSNYGGLFFGTWSITKQ